MDAPPNVDGSEWNVIGGLKRELAKRDNPESREHLRAVNEVSASLLRAASAEEGRKLFSEFLVANPKLASALVFGNGREHINFVAEVCAHYAMVKEQRPLTEEEKRLGNGLLDILALVKENLAILSGLNSGAK